MQFEFAFDWSAKSILAQKSVRFRLDRVGVTDE